jgi:phosphoglycolate phosphatase-like HAD superfamily hydrolase
MRLFKLILCLMVITHVVMAQSDPLPSWNEGKAKSTIINFVTEAIKPGGANFIPKEERIATFDQDGTLWVEQPEYTQVVFTADQVRELADKHPEWRTQEPFKTVIERGVEGLKTLSEQQVAHLIAVIHSGMTVEQFLSTVNAWLDQARHPRFNQPYTKLIYQPMLEVIRYFQENGFKTYIVSGGGQEFIRAYAARTYEIFPEHVIGTAGKVAYEYQEGKPVLKKLPEVLFIDDKQGKPASINLFIGRRPVAAFGNSTGDQQMLEWTRGVPGNRIALLVHHDDPVREYAYGPDSRIGTFSDALMKEALDSGWIVISMKNDWKQIFSFER